MNKAIFLDRDGTLNPDPGYISDPKDYELYDGVCEALVKLQEAGYMLILITNQSGISRGLISEEQLEAVHDKMKRLLKAGGVTLDAIYYCPHHPDHPYKGIAECNCRKPKPGLILQAIKDHDIDVENSFMIGDRTSDIKIGLNSGVKPVCIAEKPFEGYESVPTFSNLSLAADWVLNRA
ncbi:MAG: HAD family hydrolase [Candidatus Riflebacteria bacterium]|nr:HAD family hydrolase [Candidatus Riflebacteria bacterium]